MKHQNEDEKLGKKRRETIEKIRKSIKEQYAKGRVPWNKGLPKEQQPRYGKPVTQKQIENMRRIGKQFHHAWRAGQNESFKLVSEVLRERIYKRDGYKCRTCGMGMKEHLEIYNCRLHIHHKCNLMENRHIEDNLITLCGKHHKQIHMTGEEAKRRRLGNKR